MIHPGFKVVAANIANKEDVPMKRASAMLASKTRNASLMAKKKNPRLKMVK